MKIRGRMAALPETPRRAGEPPRRSWRGHRDGVKTSEGRAQQRHGAYKRLEIFLGQEAAIELRRLMRGGRTAREVIEALLLAEKRRQDDS